MNKVQLIGRLTKDPEIKKTSKSQISVCRFTLAIDRRSKAADGERKADFVSCIAWDKTADFLSQYFRKGIRLAIVGHIETSSWEAKGVREYRQEVVTEEIYFADAKAIGADNREQDKDVPVALDTEPNQSDHENNSALEQAQFEDFTKEIDLNDINLPF